MKTPLGLTCVLALVMLSGCGADLEGTWRVGLTARTPSEPVQTRAFTGAMALQSATVGFEGQGVLQLGDACPQELEVYATDVEDDVHQLSFYFLTPACGEEGAATFAPLTLNLLLERSRGMGLGQSLPTLRTAEAQPWILFEDLPDGSPLWQVTLHAELL